MSTPTYNVLFLCTGNSARSILAEAILRKEGAGRFVSFSAGSLPKGEVNSFAHTTLAAHEYALDGLRSKTWSEFAEAGAPCPLWPGQPITAHWGIEDPAAIEGSDIEKERAFERAFRFLRNRIGAFVSLPLQSIDRMVLGTRLKEIGAMDGSTVSRGKAG